jgi:hypothetical protein
MWIRNLQDHKIYKSLHEEVRVKEPLGTHYLNVGGQESQ